VRGSCEEDNEALDYRGELLDQVSDCHLPNETSTD
jgi:hypothetical protein